MSPLQKSSPRPLPGWLMIAGSILAMTHLLALGVLVLAAPSGPWPTPFGPSDALPPKFAEIVNEVTYKHYLQHIRMSHNYHFQSNRVAVPAVKFEVNLKDRAGEVIKTVQIPDPKANFWVRHRQKLLAQGLGDDQPVQPRTSGEVIAPKPGRMGEEVEFWHPVEATTLRLKKEMKDKVPNERKRPSEWSKLLAQSYMRHLCRQHGAESAELIRHSKDAIMPALLFLPEPPREEVMPTLKSYFGEYRREN